jgi:hypothetical protein
MTEPDQVPYSALVDTLSVSRARAIDAAIQALDYAFRATMRTTKPGIPSEVAAIFAAARLDMIAAHQRRVAEWADADALLEQVERERAAMESRYRRAIGALPDAAFGPTPAEAAAAAQDARAEAPDV